MSSEFDLTNLTLSVHINTFLLSLMKKKIMLKIFDDVKDQLVAIEQKKLK